MKIVVDWKPAQRIIVRMRHLGTNRKNLRAGGARAAAEVSQLPAGAPPDLLPQNQREAKRYRRVFGRVLRELSGAVAGKVWFELCQDGLRVRRFRAKRNKTIRVSFERLARVLVAQMELF